MINTKENNITTDKDNNETVIDEAFNLDENKKLRDELFISAKPGQWINLSVTQWGQLQVQYFNSFGLKKNKKSGVVTNWFKKEIFISPNDITKLLSGENNTIKSEKLVNYINKEINTLIEKDGAIIKEVDGVPVKGLKIDIKV